MGKAVKMEKGKKEGENNQETVESVFSAQEVGTGRLLEKIKDETPSFYLEALNYQERLRSNEDRSRRFGKTNETEADRAEIIEQLNRLSLSVVGVPFNDLCPKVAYGGSVYPQTVTVMLDSQEQGRRSHLLSSIKSRIESVLQRSLYDNQPILLHKEIRPELVIDRTGVNVSLTPLSDDEAILSIFKKMDKALLIVGEPGCGKTTTLLELAKAIHLHAIQSETEPVPVYIDLSWGNKPEQAMSEGMDMSDWLRQTLKNYYQVDMTWSWMREHIIFLLDGLDDVRDEIQTACVKAVNTLNCPFIVVCCREETYKRLPKLKLNGAIRLKPLTETQIEQYLHESDNLRRLLSTHDSLKEMAKNPLMLDIMLRIDTQSFPDNELLQEQPSTALKAYLFDKSIERKFAHSRGEPFASKDKIVTWLSWLAQAMTKRKIKSFLIEELQPNWLPTKQQHWRYFVLSRALIGFILGVWQALFVDWSRFNLQIAFTMFITISSSVVGGITAGIVESWLIKRRHKNLPLSRLHKIRQALYITLPVMMAVHVCWMFGGLFSGVLFVDELKTSPAGSLFLMLLGSDMFTQKWPIVLLAGASGVVNGLYDALVIGGSFGLFFGLQAPEDRLGKDIQRVESFKLASWKVTLKSMFRGALSGICIGTFFSVAVGLLGTLCSIFIAYLIGLLNNLSLTQLVSAIIVNVFVAFFVALALSLVNILVFGGLGTLLGGILGGLSGTRIDYKENQQPNEGTQRSGVNAVRTGVIAWIISWVISGFLFWPVYWLIASLQAPTSAGQGLLGSLGFTLSLATTIGVFVGLWYGGVTWIKHYALRFLLWREEKLPRDLIGVLNYSVNVVFLNRTRGEYRFYHTELQEHFVTKTNRLL